MPRIFAIRAFFLLGLGAPCYLAGQTPDPSLDDAVKEIALLKRLAAEQDRRAADQERRILILERTVRSLQTTVLAASRPVTTNRWRTAEGWAAVKRGMSRAQVEEILGEPKSVDAVIDRQTLHYKEGNDPVGDVVIIDDRVSEVTSRRFQIYAPTDK